MAVIDFSSAFGQAEVLLQSGKIEDSRLAYEDLYALSQADSDVGLMAKAAYSAGLANSLGVGIEKNTYFQQAQERFETSVELFTSVNDPVGSGLAECSIGQLYQKIDRHTEGLTHFQKSLTYLPEEENAKRAFVLGKIGVSMSSSSTETPGLLAHFKNADAMFDQVPSDRYFHALFLYDWGLWQIRHKEIDSAIQLISEGLSWFQADHGKVKYIYYQLHGLLLQSIAYVAENDLPSAKSSWRSFEQIERQSDPLAVKCLRQFLEEASG